MANPLQVKGVVQPELSDVLLNFKQDIFSTLNCIKIGEIQSFDPNKRTAQVQILFKRTYPDGSVKSYQPIVDCPVWCPQGGGGALQFPIAKGDQCLVLFSDRRLDEWFTNGSEAAPADGRMHDISDGIALVGLNALPSNLPPYPTDKVVLSYMGSQFELTSTGWNFVGDGGAELDLAGEIVTIKNTTTTLLTLINGFITLLEGAQVQGPGVFPFTTAFIAQLEAYKTQFATLLG